MAVTHIMTVDDLDTMIDDEGNRYEIIDGELNVSHAPHNNHQRVSQRLATALDNYSTDTGTGEVLPTIGLIFDPKNGVIPDLVWTSTERIAVVDDGNGKLRAAPDLVIEILSPGNSNEDRDRTKKRGLYAREGMREYWLVSYVERFIEIYRAGLVLNSLALVATLHEGDTLTSPVLPDFSCAVTDIFATMR